MKFIKLDMGDYLSDTKRLNPLQHGVYFLMIMETCGTEKPLPSDPKDIAYALNIRTPSEKRALDAVLDQYWELTDAGYVNKRCEEELEKHGKRSRQNRENAQAAWDGKRSAERVRSAPNTDANRRPVVQKSLCDPPRAGARARERDRVRREKGELRGGESPESPTARASRAEPPVPPPEKNQGKGNGAVSPTEGQLDFIASLEAQHGIEVERPATKQEAGRLIDRIKAGEYAPAAKEGWRHLPGCAPPGDDKGQQWRRTPWEDMAFWMKDILQQEARAAKERANAESPDPAGGDGRGDGDVAGPGPPAVREGDDDG